MTFAQGAGRVRMPPVFVGSAYRTLLQRRRSAQTSEPVRLLTGRWEPAAPAADRYTVIYPPTIDYEYMKQRPQHLMEQFAADGHRVYYLNNRESDRPPLEVQPNLVVVYRASDIERLPRSHPVVLWMSWSETVGWIDRVRPDIAIYDCLDDFPEWAAAERLIVPRVDFVTATSDALYEKMRRVHRNVLLVRNACEYERFSGLADLPDPPDWPLHDPAVPVVGYVGALGHWLDDRMVAAIADRYEMVLVGPYLGHRTVEHPRVHYLGLRPYDALPRYLKRMQVLTIPFVDSQLTRATNPIKMYEYLATGKPVVATALPEALRTPVVRVARTPGGFLAQVEAAMREPSEASPAAAARQAFARANSWRVRYELIRDAIDAMWREKGG